MKREYPDTPIVGVGAIIRDGACIVLIRRDREPSKGRWTFPGGAVELGETVHDAVRREALEETGLQVRIKSLLNVYSYPGEAVVVAAYIAEVLAGVPTPCDETLEVGLFLYEEIPWSDLAFSSTRDALRDFEKRKICSTK